MGRLCYGPELIEFTQNVEIISLFDLKLSFEWMMSLNVRKMFN